MAFDILPGFGVNYLLVGDVLSVRNLELFQNLEKQDALPLDCIFSQDPHSSSQFAGTIHPDRTGFGLIQPRIV